MDLTGRDLRVYVAAHLNAELAGSLVVPDALTIIQKFDVGCLYALLPSIRIKYLHKLCGRLHLHSDRSVHPHAPGHMQGQMWNAGCIIGSSRLLERDRETASTP